ncbi:ubiquinol oxidase subunit II [Marinicrinis lubricantis]|uniref:Quinol oxidase subunit 2 n=1 Tax=Marinicrinis lubricantis TaxID=2086470 RepID=A0ABW1IJK5_9BACL
MKQPKKAFRYALPLLFVLMITLLSGCSDIMVMDPKGPIGESQKDLIIQTMILCGIILVPVLALAAYIVFRYRDKPNSKATYKPNWSHNNTLEAVWWGIPIVVIIILAVITVRGTYALEPSKPIESEKETLVIQATSLDWKWLFKYPEQDIATVNYVQIPEDVPIRFELTSDAPMNSFWIPQLGGQMYTMSGMAMKLHLQADEQGVYYGSGANFSGEHFADMNFEVHATSQEEFDQWVEEVKATGEPLTMEGYEALAEPGTSEPQFYSTFPEGLFEKIVTKYTVDGHGAHSGHGAVEADDAEAEEADAEMNHMDHESMDQQENEAEAAVSDEHADHH